MAHTEHRFACTLTWTGAHAGPTTSYRAYSREYEVAFDGKPALRGSAAPAFLGDPSLHDPEDLLVAALSACHCLSYLAECARAGIAVTRYSDQADGVMKFDRGAMRFVEVTLRPEVTIAPGADVARATALHDRAHELCFIANSVAFPVRHVPSVRAA